MNAIKKLSYHGCISLKERRLAKFDVDSPPTMTTTPDLSSSSICLVIQCSHRRRAKKVKRYHDGCILGPSCTVSYQTVTCVLTSYFVIQRTWTSSGMASSRSSLVNFSSHLYSFDPSFMSLPTAPKVIPRLSPSFNDTLTSTI